MEHSEVHSKPPVKEAVSDKEKFNTDISEIGSKEVQEILENNGMDLDTYVYVQKDDCITIMYVYCLLIIKLITEAKLCFQKQLLILLLIVY